MRGILSAVAVLMAGALLFEWYGWHPSEPSVAAGAAVHTPEAPPDALPKATVTEIPDLDHYVVVAERPLFVEDRHPPSADVPAENASPEEPAARPEYDLSAVVMTPAGRTALLSKPGTQGIERAVEGDTLEGWILEQIRDDRVILERQGEKNTILLRDFSEKQSSPTPNRGSAKTPPRPLRPERPERRQRRTDRNPS